MSHFQSSNIDDAINTTSGQAHVLAKTLDPAILPLQGRHLIEASAGTGKTFNITRLYLRLLLEKKLSVQQILVMTFTKAATEELRGRIDKELRHALAHWGTLGESDPFFAAIEAQFDANEAKNCLKIALLELDDAAIFTIHSFCNRALSQQAFSSGMAFEMSMEADTSELLLAAVRDWLRQVNQNKTQFELLEKLNWHIPENFVKQFSQAISHYRAIEATDMDAIQQGYVNAIEQYAQQMYPHKQIVKTQLLAEQDEILSVLVNSHKDKIKRQTEWIELIAWLDSKTADKPPKAVGDFINGNRYRGNEYFKNLFMPLKSLRDEFNKSLQGFETNKTKQSENVPVYQLVADGIRQIGIKFKLAKQTESVMDFDDLVSYLSQALQKEAAESDGQSGLINALRKQYPVALVDEFQDTDPEQYAILDILYPQASPVHSLIMIGDPKQAIYGFRGGDIFTYLAARNAADYLWVMDTNWRSVAHMVTGYNRLFWGKPLTEHSADVFSYGIDYEKIKSTPHASAAKQLLVDTAGNRAALNYVCLTDFPSDSPEYTKPTKADYLQRLSTWCANEIVRILSDVQLGEQKLKQQDIAVLVKRAAEADYIQQALAIAGLSSVYLSDRSNIFLSEQAKEIQFVLEGILNCENENLLIRALSTRLMGFDAQALARFQQAEFQDEWEVAVNLAFELRVKWQTRGCMALLMHLVHHHFVPQPENHERSLTNMIHLAEILQQAARQYKHPQQLLKWFKQQCYFETGQAESEQRLESDANLIRIVTQHSSKGLEYPIVFIPFASDFTDPTKSGKQTKHYFKYYDDAKAKTCHQIGEDETVKSKVMAQGIAESVRLLYVAVTRAEHRCYLGIAPFDKSEQSALAKTIQLPSGQKATVEDWLQQLTHVVNTAEQSSCVIQVEPIIEAINYQTNNNIAMELAPAQFTGVIEDKWSLYSFSGLTRNAHTSVKEKVIERQDDESEINAINTALSSEDLRFTLKKGAAAGNLLHDALEHTDFSQPEWLQTLATPLAHFGNLINNGQQISDTETSSLESQLIEWLNSVLQAKLPKLGQQMIEADDFCLADLTWSKTLREAEFYFPLADAQISLLLKLLKQHRQTQSSLFLPGRAELQGMMHGFIDLIFEHNGRYYLADYKSTHLGDRVEDYHYDALKLNNQTHFYDLQYLIYAVALHRYLSVRLTHYSPEQHFGGVYYLYLRGMAAENTQAFGVYSTEIELKLLQKLDQVFSPAGGQSEDLECDIEHKSDSVLKKTGQEPHADSHAGGKQPSDDQHTTEKTKTKVKASPSIQEDLF